MGMDTFYGDTFDNGFGSFETVKRAHPQSKPLYRCESKAFSIESIFFSLGFCGGSRTTAKAQRKRHSQLKSLYLKVLIFISKLQTIDWLVDTRQVFKLARV